MILSTMQHALTPAQEAELEVLYPGVPVVLLKDRKPELFAALAQSPKDSVQTAELARQLWDLVRHWSFGPAQDIDVTAVVLPIGSPQVMFQFARLVGFEADGRRGYNESLSGWVCPPVLFAHTQRVSHDVPNADGSVTKTFVFKHEGFEVIA